MTDQPKIKAGDLVRIVGGAYPEYGIPIGAVRQVHDVLDDEELDCQWVYIFDQDRYLRDFCADELEFVTSSDDDANFTLPGIHLEEQYADVKDAIGHANRTSPLAYVDRSRWTQPVKVATLRDQFAMAATDEDVRRYQEFDADRPCKYPPKYSPAQARYRFADAMLAARMEGRRDE